MKELKSKETYRILHLKSITMKIINLLAVLISNISTAQNITDGKATDWTLPLKNYDSQAHIQYTAINNDSVLFICVRIPDSKFQMKVAKAGMSLYIDTTGKEKQSIAINFPIKEENPKPMKIGKPGEFPTAQQARAEVEPSLKKFKSKGFIAGNGTYILKNIEDMIVAAAYDDSDILTIEYQIPLKIVYHKLCATDIDKKVTIQFEINSLPMPQMPEGASPMGGGGMPPTGGENMPNMQDLEEFFQSSNTTLKYSFVKK